MVIILGIDVYINENTNLTTYASDHKKSLKEKVRRDTLLKMYKVIAVPLLHMAVELEY